MSVEEISVEQLEWALRKTRAMLYPVTPRQREIIELLVQGKSQQQAATHLHLSVKTVKSHLNLLYRSQGLTCAHHATAWWVGEGRELHT